MAEFKIETNLAEIGNKQITANFEETLATVREIVAPYTALVVTPDTIRQAAGDRARLRKMKNALDDYRKTAKAECMKPYTAFEERMKPIFAAIDEAVANIDGQVKAFEAAAEQEKLNELHAFFESLLTDETRDFADWEKIKNPRWKNKTYDPVQARNEIHMAVAEVERSLAALRGYPEPYKSSMLVKYKETGRLSDAINVYTLTKQREAAEAERNRQKEEAARRAAEEAERQKAEAAAQADRAAQELSNAMQSEMTHAAAENAAQGNESGESAQNEAPKTRRVEFWVEVTKEQSVKLGRFLRENGIKYGAIR